MKNVTAYLKYFIVIQNQLLFAPWKLQSSLLVNDQEAKCF